MCTGVHSWIIRSMDLVVHSGHVLGPVRSQADTPGQCCVSIIHLAR